jgi:hypothetical protein
MGLSLHNGLAVLEGLIGRKTPFVRTPKFNLLHKSDSWKTNVYIQTKVNSLTIGEALLCIYFIFGIAVGIQLKDYGLLLFHAMMAVGFGSVFYYSMKSAVHAS